MKKTLLQNKVILGIIFLIVFELLIYLLEPIINNIKLLTGILITVSIIGFMIYVKNKKISQNRITTLIIIIGVLLRTMYILNTPITERQHDVEDLTINGHLNYIYTIYKTGKLPTTHDMQFYHPPLFHAIGAGWLKINELFKVPLERSLEGLQVLTVIFSSLMLFVLAAIISRLKIKDNYKHLANLFFCVNPTLIILAGSINNDCLEILLQFLIILSLIIWYENTNIKNTIILGIITGLCIMCKLNGIIMLIPIGYIFLDKIMKIIKTKQSIKHLTIKIMIFITLALSIGLWFQIREILLFGNNKIPGPGNYLSIANYTFFERFYSISFSGIYKKIFCQIPGDYNIIAYIVKCSIFGEFSYNIPIIMYYIMVTLNLLLIIISAILIIKYIIKTKNKIILMDLLIINYLTNILSYLYFNIKYPYICTMDFRYIVATLLTGIGIIIFETNNTKNKYMKYSINITLLLFIISCFIFIFYI